MNNLLNITFLGLIFGMLGTTCGGAIGAFFNIKKSKYIGFILEFAAGLMLSIICFELIPEALNLSGMIATILGIFLGIIVMIMCDNKIDIKYSKNNSLIKTGIIIGIGLAIHNFPEGLAIGSGFDTSKKLGYALAIAICMHDVPEGIAIALPLKNGGMKKSKTIIYTMLSGITTGIGALFGAIIGIISTESISISLAFAAGAMLYIVSGELIPESKKIYRGRLPVIGNVLGFILGIIGLCI